MVICFTYLLQQLIDYLNLLLLRFLWEREKERLLKESELQPELDLLLQPLDSESELDLLLQPLDSVRTCKRSTSTSFYLIYSRFLFLYQSSSFCF